ncbi:glycosyltransferase family 2 protein [Psychrobacter namhaensis]|uniref:glycosyltransferase family 2 protein n=1 Tax=Psychrobacter namhaensis TaxID=292734 RepID=UPI003FD2ECDA
MSFQILVSTMNNKFHSRNLTLDIPHLIINQITKDIRPVEDKHTINMYTSGLSVSRNEALSNASSDICLISDDDLTYIPNIHQSIQQVFNLYPDADIITFKISRSEGEDYKKYPNKPFYHNMRTLMKVSSVEIAIRRNVIEDKLRFDEDFGLGAKYPTGEEIIFLTDALKQGKSILFYPLTIANHPDISSGSNYSIGNLAKAKGAMLYRVFSSKSYLLCLAFAIKHHTKTPYTLKEFTRELIGGALEYKERMKKEIDN